MAMRNWITPAGTGPSGTVDEGRRAKLPQANIPVANRMSHGTIRANATTGVASSRMAPRAPPMRLIANSARNGVAAHLGRFLPDLGRPPGRLLFWKSDQFLYEEMANAA